MSRPIAFVNARLADPASGLDVAGGLLVRDGRIIDLGPSVFAAGLPDAEIVDCGGRVLAPGLVDLKVSTGEPGDEHRETIASAGRAAAAGGVTTIALQPDTTPPVDDPASVMAEIMERTKSGDFGWSDSVDPASVKIWYYKPA